MKWNRIDARANEIKSLIVTAMLLFVMATVTATAQDTGRWTSRRFPHRARNFRRSFERQATNLPRPTRASSTQLVSRARSTSASREWRWS